MVNYQESRVELTNTQKHTIKQIKSAVKNKKRAILRSSKKNFEDE